MKIFLALITSLFALTSTAVFADNHLPKGVDVKQLFSIEKASGSIVTLQPGATSAAIHNHLTIAAIDQQKGLFNVRELHDMGSSGVQQIDYVVNCSNQTLALAGFAVVTSKGRLTSNSPAASYANLSFYKPMIEHDQRIASNVCGNLLTMNTSTAK